MPTTIGIQHAMGGNEHLQCRGRGLSYSINVTECWYELGRLYGSPFVMLIGHQQCVRGDVGMHRFCNALCVLCGADAPWLCHLLSVLAPQYVFCVYNRSSTLDHMSGLSTEVMNSLMACGPRTKDIM
jgi:hypothetical protein